jgi:hypothetical protein
MEPGWRWRRFSFLCLVGLLAFRISGAVAYSIDDVMADHTAAAIDFAEAGDMAAAVVSFRAATAFTPDVPEHWYNLAEALSDQDWQGSTTDAAKTEAVMARAKHAALEAKVRGGTLRQGLVEEVLWDAKTAGGKAPEFPAALIILPEEVSKITKTKWKPPVGHADFDADCGWSEWVTAWDRLGDPLLTSIDRFFNEEVAATLRRDGIRSKWEPADIHPDNKLKDDPRKGNGFPGLRVDAVNSAKEQTKACLRPILELVNPNFSLRDAETVQTLYGLVDKNLQPGGIWLDSQRLPHTDTKWDLGVLAGGEVPTSYACVYTLTNEFNNSGTALFLEKESGFSLLKTLSMNERAQGNFNPHHTGRRHPEINLLEEIPDPHPHQMKYMKENAWVKMIMVSYLRYNRFVLYDGRRLHNQYLEPEDYPRLSANPATGRLTMNTFLWARGGR